MKEKLQERQHENGTTTAPPVLPAVEEMTRLRLLHAYERTARIVSEVNQRERLAEELERRAADIRLAATEFKEEFHRAEAEMVVIRRIAVVQLGGDPDKDNIKLADMSLLKGALAR